jgi:hypothetical protein
MMDVAAEPSGFVDASVSLPRLAGLKLRYDGYRTTVVGRVTILWISRCRRSLP